MTLQFLVPQYNETDEIVKPLLDSIALQQNVNFEEIGVIICNDGSDIHLTDEFLNSYPFKIEYYLEPHRGVSGTRNACLDHSAADYVMFCDADDMFFNACGLWMIFQEIGPNGGFDSLTSIFVEETRMPDPNDASKMIPIYVNRELDSTFVHGKIHKRAYLLDKKIRWNEALTIHEDGFFNVLCQNLSENVKYCQTPFYLWKWRDDSVCRHDPKYILKTYNNMIDSMDALAKEFINREHTDKAAAYVGSCVFDAYYTMNKPEWINQENKEYRDNTEKRFSRFFKKYRILWEGLSDQDKMGMSMQIRNRAVMEGMGMEQVTIDAWLKWIERL